SPLEGGAGAGRAGGPARRGASAADRASRTRRLEADPDRPARPRLPARPYGRAAAGRRAQSGAGRGRRPGARAGARARPARRPLPSGAAAPALSPTRWSGRWAGTGLMASLPEPWPLVVVATGLEARAVRRALPAASVMLAGVALSRLPAGRSVTGAVVTCGLAGGLRGGVPTGAVLVPRQVLRPA